MGLRNYWIKSDKGYVVFSANSSSPRVLLIHGFKRQAMQLGGWGELIPGLGFVHLPGHSGTPKLTEVSIEAWIEGFRAMVAALPQPPLIIAESLGAIVALSIPSRAVIAVEPLLSVDQLWPLHRTIRRARARGDEIDPELEGLFEEPFTWVLERINAPTLVLAGDEPLLPERPTLREPSLLTDKDFEAYARHPLVEAHRIAGGHTLMGHNPQGVLEASRTFMIRHGYLDPTGAD